MFPGKLVPQNFSLTCGSSTKHFACSEIIIFSWRFSLCQESRKNLVKNGVRWRLSEIQSGLDYLNKMALMYKTGLIICCFLIATEVGSRSIFDNDGKWVLIWFLVQPFLVCILVCAIGVVQSCKLVWIKWSAVYFKLKGCTLWQTVIFVHLVFLSNFP